MSKEFTCTICGTKYKRVGAWRRHSRKCRGCNKCGRTFPGGNTWRIERHERTCTGERTESAVRDDLAVDRVYESTTPRFGDLWRGYDSTRLIDDDEDDMGVESAEERNRRSYFEASAHTNNFLWMDRDGPYGDEFDERALDEEDREVMDVVVSNWRSMSNFYKCHKIMDVLNVRIWDPEDESYEVDAMEALKKAWTSVNWQCKINASVGCLLVHKVTGAVRYFHSSPNDGSLLEKPAGVSSEEDLEDFWETIASKDLQEISKRRRPNTEWRLHALTNLTFYVYKLIGVSKVGSGESLSATFPQHLKRNKHLICLLTDPKTGEEYGDNLCFFRCLALHTDCKCPRGDCLCVRPSRVTVKRLFDHYTQVTGTSKVNFQGLDEDHLLEVEEIFDVAVTVFQRDDTPEGMSVVVWNSKRRKGSRLNIHVHGQHFSYIRNVDKFCKSFKCSRCEAFFVRPNKLRIHSCDVKRVTRMTFPGGVFGAPLNIFDKLERDANITVDREIRFYPYVITYDIECYLAREDLPNPTTTTEFVSEHNLLSVSVCSNIPGYQHPQCFVVETDADECVSRFVDYLENAAETAENIMLRKFQPVLKRLKAVLVAREEIESRFEEMPFSNNSCHASRRGLCGLMGQLRSYLRTVPVVGFNSQKYDLNVLKTPLIKRLLFSEDDEDDDEEGENGDDDNDDDDEDEDGEETSDRGIEHVVKKQESMTTLQTKRLRFLDITNFISPGFNYDSYLKAYKTQQAKGFFPYEWMDCLDKLNYATLPPQEAFYSKLKRKGITLDEYRVVEEAWRDNDMKTVRDLLVWYNNLDVQPFVEALLKQIEVYKSRNIDMLKEAVSAPGISVLWLFDQLGSRTTLKQAFENAELSDQCLYRRVQEATVQTRLVHRLESDARGEELYDLFRSNLVGGPSIVFHRYHEHDRTKLREQQYGAEAELCKLVLGLDANALYLFCIMQQLPVGMPRIRLPENNFRIERGKKMGKTAQGWLAWQELITGQEIETSLNGVERRLGRHNLPVDGFCQATNTVYQFHGCYWHGHGCSLDTSERVRNKSAEERLRDTIEKEEYLEALGYTMVVRWECEWRREVDSNHMIKVFLAAFFSKTYGNVKKGMNQQELIDAVRNDKLFGFVECDITVPDHLKSYFSEMCPIFKNVELSREHLSEHMKEFAEENNTFKRPQRYLVGSMKGEKILLMTELLRWYLAKGLVVTKVYRVIEYEKRAIFKEFGESITQARRAGDASPDLKLLADTSKLIGNSAYGKLCQDKSKHKQVTYTLDDRKVALTIRGRYFHSLNILEEKAFEVSKFKKKINMDVCVHIGNAILQYAKLRMLRFHYDFLDRFVDRRNYQAVYMDTDSNYMALSDSLLKLIKPECLNEFSPAYKEWMVLPFCPEHELEFFEAVRRGAIDEWNNDRQCCKDFNKWDGRTPGKFKEEFKGKAIVALNSKTYICSKATDGDDNVDRSSIKLSSKGLSKRTNNLRLEDYKSVLLTKTSIRGTNTGIMRKRNKTYTYIQQKKGLSYLYTKRKVCADGISTTPLDI